VKTNEREERVFGSDFAKVDAHVIAPEEYVDAPDLSGLTDAELVRRTTFDVSQIDAAELSTPSADARGAGAVGTSRARCKEVPMK
jgi:hypothetical protein